MCFSLCLCVLFYSCKLCTSSGVATLAGEQKILREKRTDNNDILHICLKSEARKNWHITYTQYTLYVYIDIYLCDIKSDNKFNSKKCE